MIAIDPSYTRTGIFYTKDDTFKVSSVSITNKMIYDISEALKCADLLARDIVNLVSLNDLKTVVIEYPVLATRSGAYLGLIQQALFTRLKLIGFLGIELMLPAQAVNSVTRAKNKTQIVEWAKKSFNYNEKINHDEATAMVLYRIGKMVLNSTYKNSYKIIDFKKI